MAPLMMILWSALVIQSAYGDGECGKTPVDRVVVSLRPCIEGTRVVEATLINPICCIQVKKVLAFPPCLCAIFLSPIMEEAGVTAALGLTFPKLCNITSRPVGKKCGSYTVP